MTAGRDPYGSLGNSYATRRGADPRIARLIRAALGDARTVLNVGAGTGSYEPAGRCVAAVEPSAVMIGQRAALAVLTVHHWASPAAGLAELRRVARRQVVLTWDPQILARFWLVRDYLPEIAERERTLACLAVVRGGLARGGRDPAVWEVPVPGDCADGFLGAYWRRPEAYLSPAIRSAMSGIALLDQHTVTAASGRLAADLAGGRWHERHGQLLERGELDLGYRLVATRL